MTSRSAQDTRRLASFAIDRLSPRVRTAVLEDGQIGQQYSLPITRSLMLRENLSIDRDDLINALRSAVSGDSVVRVKVQPTGSEATISMRGDGSAVIELETTRFVFGNAALAATEADRRLAAFETIPAQDSLSVIQADELRALLAKADYTVDDFETVNDTIAKSPSAFLADLANQFEGERLAFADIVPSSPIYWNALIPPPAGSITQADYVEAELRGEWEARLAQRPPERAYRAMAMTFGAPSLVPTGLLRGVSSDGLLRMVGEARTFLDPFAIIGTIKLCADLADERPELAAAGLELLAELATKLPELGYAFHVYSAALVSATSFLAQHDELSLRPSFWKRMAAAAHAAIVVEAAGPYQQRDRLVEWAWGHSGMEFTLSVTNELPDLPRWLPDWAQPDHLLADALGRITSLTHGEAESGALETWNAHLTTVRDFMVGKVIAIYAIYPAILEGDLPRRDRTLESFGADRSFIDAAVSENTLESFLVLEPLVFGWGMPPDMGGIARSALAVAARDPDGFANLLVRKTLAFASIVALQLKNRELADEIAEMLLSLAPAITEPQMVFEAILTTMKCSYTGRSVDDGRALATLRLERLAAVCASGDVAAAIHRSLVKLQKCDSSYRKNLGRAVAIATLGLR
jgi:hypothetical protein